MSKFNFEGRTIRLLPSLFVSITMNPGYAGRSPLPDNLIDLFRPIAMSVPDYEPVAEVLLFSGGKSPALPCSFACSEKKPYTYIIVSSPTVDDHAICGLSIWRWQQAWMTESLSPSEKWRRKGVSCRLWHKSGPGKEAGAGLQALQWAAESAGALWFWHESFEASVESCWTLAAEPPIPVRRVHPGSSHWPSQPSKGCRNGHWTAVGSAPGCVSGCQPCRPGMQQLPVHSSQSMIQVPAARQGGPVSGRSLPLMSFAAVSVTSCSWYSSLRTACRMAVECCKDRRHAMEEAPFRAPANRKVGTWYRNAIAGFRPHEGSFGWCADSTRLGALPCSCGQGCSAPGLSEHASGSDAHWTCRQAC